MTYPIHIGLLTLIKAMLVNVAFLVYALSLLGQIENSQMFVSGLFFIYILFVLRAYLLRFKLEDAYPGNMYVRRINDLANNTLIAVGVSVSIYVLGSLIDNAVKIGIAPLLFWPTMCVAGGAMFIFGPIILGMTLSQISKRFGASQ